ncbi:MAG: hypothetical protein KF893_20530 [Caldilineaceae bacterium]|nr:hypothetical protein [Caldilineaceae bacterium]
MNRHLRSIGFILLILSLLIAMPLSALAAVGDVTLTTPKTTVDGNERFLVSVNVEAPAGLYGVQLSLQYDDTKLNVLNVSAGSAWPVANTFVARATASGGGSAAETIEFAATLNNAGTLSGSGAIELVSILVEAENPPAQTTTTIGITNTLPLIFSNASGNALTVNAPANLVITINEAPEVTGAVTLQSPGTGRTVAVTGVSTDSSSAQGQASVEVASAAPFALSLPTGDNFMLTAVAACHLTAEKTGVDSPSSGHTVTLLAGDINGDNRINIQDLAAIGNRFGLTPLPAQLCTDLNQDDIVNILDLSRAASNYGTQGPQGW